MRIAGTLKDIDTPMPISSRASNEEGSTTIRVDGVHSSEWKHMTPQGGDDIVCPAEKSVAAKLYKITNTVNNKIYIGYTTTSLARRMASHRFAAKNGSTSYLHNAFRKYGDVFTIELISEHFSIEKVKQAEVNLISEIRKAGIENYNLLAGGNGGLYVKDIEAWKQKLRIARIGGKPSLGMKHSEETKRKCSEASKKRWEKQRIKSNDLN